MKDFENIICACSSFEHSAVLWKDEENNLYVYFHLVTYKNFFKRLWHGIRYAFGYKSRYGAWDEFIFDEENEKKLRDYLNNKNGYITMKTISYKNCVSLKKVMCHPQNENIGKGAISEQLGWVCTFQHPDKSNEGQYIFFELDKADSWCENHLSSKC